MTLEVPLSAEVEILRKKCVDDTVTDDELRAFIAKLRSGRMMAASAPAKKRPSAVIPAGIDLIDDL